MEKQAAISKMLLELGVPAHLLGYELIACAVNLALENKALLRQITKTLYPTVAKKFDTTASCVERAIRHAIETAWLRGGIDAQIDYFGNSIDPMKGKPTNKEFISAVVKCFMVEVAV